MKIAVLGASGRAGSEITKELASRGHSVVAIARKPEAIPVAPGVTALGGDASDAAALANLIRGCDAVISALHHDIKAETLLQALKTAGVPRLLVTGGAGSLEVAPGLRRSTLPIFRKNSNPTPCPASPSWRICGARPKPTGPSSPLRPSSRKDRAWASSAREPIS